MAPTLCANPLRTQRIYHHRSRTWPEVRSTTVSANQPKEPIQKLPGSNIVGSRHVGTTPRRESHRLLLAVVAPSPGLLPLFRLDPRGMRYRYYRDGACWSGHGLPHTHEQQGRGEAADRSLRGQTGVFRRHGEKRWASSAPRLNKRLRFANSFMNRGSYQDPVAHD